MFLNFDTFFQVSLSSHVIGSEILFHNCSDPLEGGGTIYSTGFFFFVQ